jgi:hypothetical protein
MVCLQPVAVKQTREAARALPIPRCLITSDFFNFGNSLTVQGRVRLPFLPFSLQMSRRNGSSKMRVKSPCVV